MRIVSLLIIVVSFLIGCSPVQDEEPNGIHLEENNRVEEVKLSKEEKLLDELPEDASLDDWDLILVNPFQSLSDNFDTELTEVDNEQEIDSRIVEAWTSWKTDALKDGHHLFLASGFRDVSRQEVNFNRSIQKYIDEGMTENEAVEKSKEYLTEPGHSEHHTGLALDIVDEEWIIAGQGLEPTYANEESQKWLVSSMTDYGFILRYPEGKEAITGINYEPWHFRYVGVENAKFIEENNLVLEEYIKLLIKTNK